MAILHPDDTDFAPVREQRETTNHPRVCLLAMALLLIGTALLVHFAFKFLT